MRGRHEHRAMKIEDFTFRKDENSTQYLTYAEGITNRQSGLHEIQRLVTLKMFETKTARCPLSLFICIHIYQSVPFR